MYFFVVINYQFKEKKETKQQQKKESLQPLSEAGTLIKYMPNAKTYMTKNVTNVNGIFIQSVIEVMYKIIDIQLYINHKSKM